MSMSTHVVLLRSKDDPIYQRNLKVLLACEAAGVRLPSELDEYFGGYGTSFPEYPLQMNFAPRKWRNGSAEGVEVDVDQLPPGVNTIRFYNLW